VSTWVTSTLGKECSIAIGGTPARKRLDFWDINKQTENHWVAIADLKGRFIRLTAEMLSDEGVRNSSAKLVKRGTVLLSFKLTVGRAAIADIDLYTNEAIAALRSETLDELFLYYGVQSWNLLADLDQAIKGATLNKEKLKRIPITFPKCREIQVVIARVLDKVDQVIEKTEALLAKQQGIKRGLMHDLLTRGLDAQGCLRDPSTHRFKYTDIGYVPFDWDVVPLETLVPPSSPICYGIVQVGPYTFGGVPTIAIRDLNDIRVQNLHHTDPEREKQFSRSRCEAGDLLISIKATIGRIGLAPDGFNGNISRDLARVRLLPSECPSFFKYQLQSAAGQSRLESITVGTTRKELSIIPLRSLLLVRPKPDEQQMISVKVQRLEADLAELDRSIDKLLLLKAGLMRDLIAGRVPVSSLLSNPNL